MPDLTKSMYRNESTGKPLIAHNSTEWPICFKEHIQCQILQIHVQEQEYREAPNSWRLKNKAFWAGSREAQVRQENFNHKG